MRENQQAKIAVVCLNRDKPKDISYIQRNVRNILSQRLDHLRLIFHGSFIKTPQKAFVFPTVDNDIT